MILAFAMTLALAALDGTMAAKVIAIAVIIYPILQGVKKAIPSLSGWYAVALNVVLALGGVIVAVPANQLFSVGTLLMFITAATAAAGIHGTIKSLTAPDSADATK